MSPQPVQIPWGTETLTLQLPEHWHLVGILEPSSLPPVKDVRQEILRALGEPEGMERLQGLVKPGTRVALVVDDISRPTPVCQIAPLVVAELDAAGVRREDIHIIPALGLHRPMTRDELARRVGAEILDTVQWENPDCDDPGTMVFLGTTSRGTPVWVNKTAVEADLVISIGCIEPHIIASFGGGYKNLVPGIAGRQTIAHNHALNCSPTTFNNVGREISQNPMRLDLEEAAGLLKANVFIVNAILDYRQEVVQMVCGHPIEAHRKGAQISARLYAARVEKPVDVVITASHPMDSDLRQGVKALANTIRAARPGGVVLTYVRAAEGTGVFGLANRKLPVGKQALRALAPVILPLVPKLKLKGMGEEDRFFLYFALQAMRHARLFIYAPTIPQQVKANLPFLDFFDSAQDGIELARKRAGKRPEVLVFPHGGITYPELG